MPISKRQDVNPKEGINEYGKVEFADSKNHKYPIDTPAHVHAAWSYVGMPKNQAKYSPSEVATIKKNIISAWKKKIDKNGPPSAQESNKESSSGNFINWFFGTDTADDKLITEVNLHAF